MQISWLYCACLLERRHPCALQSSQSPVSCYCPWSLLVRSDLIHLLQKYRHKTEISLTDVYTARRSYRGKPRLVEQLFQMAAEQGAGQVLGAATEGCRGRNSAPLRLALTWTQMTEQQRQALRVVAGIQPRHMLLDVNVPPVVDLGDAWGNYGNSCVAVHLHASLLHAGVDLSEELEKLATGLPTDMTPTQGMAPPKALQGVSQRLMQLRLCLCIVYVSSLGQEELGRVWLGDQRSGEQMLPMYVSVRAQHCYLGKQFLRTQTVA